VNSLRRRKAKKAKRAGELISQRRVESDSEAIRMGHTRSV